MTLLPARAVLLPPLLPLLLLLTCDKKPSLGGQRPQDTLCWWVPAFLPPAFLCEIVLFTPPSSISAPRCSYKLQDTVSNPMKALLLLSSNFFFFSFPKLEALFLPPVVISVGISTSLFQTVFL